MAKITLPKNLKTLGSGAFTNCVTLHKIVLPEGLTSTGTYTFSGCSALECVYIPRSLMRIESCMFQYCKIIEICYGGSEARWNSMSIAGYAENGTNRELYNAPKHFNCQPSDINKYAKF